MKILILGGPKFLGRALIDAALAAGHEVTLFNRGQTNADAYPDLEKLTGDRDGNLDALKGRKWDVAIDTCGYVPRLVAASAQLLADAVEHYTFVSSISVYEESVNTRTNADESYPVATIEDETVEEITGETYGALKALCEQAAEAAMPGRVLSVRSGLIVGPYDPTDRFTYWPVKLSRGGEVLAPLAETKLQIIDVRDLATWIIRMAEGRKAGAYNVTGPDSPLPFSTLVDACKAAIGDNMADVVMSSDDFLKENEVAPWMNMPLWIPADMNGMQTINVDKAIANGLTFRPLKDTVKDTLDWFNAERADSPELQGNLLSPEREAELIAAWKNR